MDEPSTCGMGLAEHSALTAKLGALTEAVAENLEVHLKALDVQDENARKEHEAYVGLVKAHRAIAGQLQATAQQMAGYRDLPMGRHDEKALSDPKVLEAFERLVRLEKELLALLQKFAERDEKMLLEVRGADASGS